jgi:uracil-DNA glycosylase family 4
MTTTIEEKPQRRPLNECPIWPLDAPGMPPPGDAFLRIAKARGGSYEMMAEGKSKTKKRMAGHTQEVTRVIRQALYGQGGLTVSLPIKNGKHAKLSVINGHRWGANPDGASLGPEPCDIMVIGKMLGDTEVNLARCMRGPSGQFFLGTLTKLGIPKVSKWYVTNALKTENPDPTEKSLKAGWVNEFHHLLQQELRLVKPKFILCLGGDAVKALLGKSMTIEKIRGRVIELPIDMRVDDEQNLEEHLHTAHVMACEHPAAVMREPDKEPRFELDLARFYQLTQGRRWDQVEAGLDHRVISNELQLRDLIHEAEQNNPSRIVAIDAEWHGNHPANIGAYMRCLQFSWAHKKAACIAVTGVGGVPSFQVLLRDDNGKPIRKNGKLVWTTKGGWEVACTMLRKYFHDKRLVGHFANADLEWLVHYGLDVREQFKAPEDWTKCRTQGGWDTGLMAHALCETDLFSLTDQTLRYTKAPRYDVELDEWKAEYCRRHKLKPKQMEGYGECPENVLYPYANYDADVTRRLAVRHAKMLDCDAYGNNCWESFWISQRAMPAALEITRTGLLIDRKRMDELTADFMFAKNKLASEIRKRFRWRDLNLESPDQIRELMFGTELNGKKDDRGRPIRLRPMCARSLRAMPAITTCKRPKDWELLVEEGSSHNYKASTNKMALGILLRESKKLKVRRGNKWVIKDYGKEIELVRNYRFISQVLKSVLRKPTEKDEEDVDDPWERDESGNWVYESGLPGAICTDGRIRTFVSQVKETGRWSTSRPPTQNFSKRREADYKKILKEYKFPLRSIFMADPGYVLVEADYVGAELFGMAIMSGDIVMIDHATRNQLPEDDPNFYDIHSNIAVLAFGYTCAPTKKGLRDIGKEHMRIVAKSVIFGVAYGRGAKAIALAAREEGVVVSVEEAQQIIDTIFKMYPGLVPFFQECKERAVQSPERDAPVSPRFLCGPFGRFRRFPLTNDREVMGEFERQAMNFTIQGMIADAMSRAVDYLQQYRTQHKLGFKIVMQIHDALLFLVPYAEVGNFIDVVLPECMAKKVPIYPCKLDGTPTGAGPYHLGTDNELSVHWGVHMLPHECWERGIHEKYAGWAPSKNFEKGWVCSYFNKRVWLEKTQKLHDLVSDKSGKEKLKEDAIRLAKKLGRLPPGIEVADATKKMKIDDLMPLITNKEGMFVAA